MTSDVPVSNKRARPADMEKSLDNSKSTNDNNNNNNKRFRVSDQPRNNYLVLTRNVGIYSPQLLLNSTYVPSFRSLDLITTSMLRQLRMSSQGSRLLLKTNVPEAFIRFYVTFLANVQILRASHERGQFDGNSEQVMDTINRLTSSLKSLPVPGPIVPALIELGNYHHPIFGRFGPRIPTDTQPVAHHNSWVLATTSSRYPPLPLMLRQIEELNRHRQSHGVANITGALMAVAANAASNLVNRLGITPMAITYPDLSVRDHEDFAAIYLRFLRSGYVAIGNIARVGLNDLMCIDCLENGALVYLCQLMQEVCQYFKESSNLSDIPTNAAVSPILVATSNNQFPNPLAHRNAGGVFLQQDYDVQSLFPISELEVRKGLSCLYNIRDPVNTIPGFAAGIEFGPNGTQSTNYYLHLRRGDIYHSRVRNFVPNVNMMDYVRSFAISKPTLK